MTARLELLIEKLRDAKRIGIQFENGNQWTTKLNSDERMALIRALENVIIERKEPQHGESNRTA